MRQLPLSTIFLLVLFWWIQSFVVLSCPWSIRLSIPCCVSFTPPSLLCPSPFLSNLCPLLLPCDNYFPSYFDKVLPKEYGVTEHPLLCLQPSVTTPLFLIFFPFLLSPPFVPVPILPRQFLPPPFFFFLRKITISCILFQPSARIKVFKMVNFL